MGNTWEIFLSLLSTNNSFVRFDHSILTTDSLFWKTERDI